MRYGEMTDEAKAWSYASYQAKKGENMRYRCQAIGVVLMALPVALVLFGSTAQADVRQGTTETVNGKPACNCTSPTNAECGCVVEVEP